MTDTDTAYRVARWQTAYENSQSRKILHLRWVAMPNDLSALPYRRVVSLHDGAALWGAWCALLCLASAGEGQDRGYLTRDGRALTAGDLALMTGLPSDVVERALDVLSAPDVGLLEPIPSGESPGIVGEFPDASGESPDGLAGSPGVTGESPSIVGLNRTELNRIESNRTEKKSARATPLPSDYIFGDEHRLIAETYNLDIADEFLNFSEHAYEQGRVCVEWDSAFERWLRESAKRKAAAGGR